MNSIHYFRFNEVLEIMVSEGKLSNEERELLLTKAGLLKLNDQEWKQEDGAILKFVSNTETN